MKYNRADTCNICGEVVSGYRYYADESAIETNVYTCADCIVAERDELAEKLHGHEEAMRQEILVKGALATEVEQLKAIRNELQSENARLKKQLESEDDAYGLLLENKNKLQAENAQLKAELERAKKTNAVCSRCGFIEKVY